MRSPVFQVNVIEFLLLLLVVTAQAAVDVFILDKKEYPDNSFTLDHLKCDYNDYPKIKGKAFVAVQAEITVDEDVAKITWPNSAIGSQQVTAPDGALNIGPEYNNAFFAVATNPDIDGRRSFIIPTSVSLIEGQDIQIKFSFTSLTNEEKEMLNEINKLQTSRPTFETAQETPPPPQVFVQIDKGSCGQIYSVTYTNGPLVGKDVVMKTCEANEPGKVVSLKKWAGIDFMEKINRNDYRIGRLLNTMNEENNKVGPKYYSEGRIEIKGIHCYYFTMEKIIGKPIDDDFSEANVAGLDAVVSKFAQNFLKMLNAIIRLHKAGVLHRDLHNGNFMKLEGSGEYVIIDYGMSRVAVEWENHIKQNRPIATQSATMFQSLRADIDLGTDFQDEMDSFVFYSLTIYIDEEFFGNDNTPAVLICNKIKLLVSNWLKWPHIHPYFDTLTDYIAPNLNDMLFLSPTLLYCRNVHTQKLEQDQLKLSLKAMDDQLFSKNADQVIEYEFDRYGYLVKDVLPAVQDMYKWPEYEKYKNSLSNIMRKEAGKRSPSDNPL